MQERKERSRSRDKKRDKSRSRSKDKKADRSKEAGRKKDRSRSKSKEKKRGRSRSGSPKRSKDKRKDKEDRNGDEGSKEEENEKEKVLEKKKAEPLSLEELLAKKKVRYLWEGWHGKDGADFRLYLYRSYGSTVGTYFTSKLVLNKNLGRGTVPIVDLFCCTWSLKKVPKRGWGLKPVYSNRQA